MAQGGFKLLIILSSHLGAEIKVSHTRFKLSFLKILI